MNITNNARCSDQPRLTSSGELTIGVQSEWLPPWRTFTKTVTERILLLLWWMASLLVTCVFGPVILTAWVAAGISKFLHTELCIEYQDDAFFERAGMQNLTNDDDLPFVDEQESWIREMESFDRF